MAVAVIKISISLAFASLVLAVEVVADAVVFVLMFVVILLLLLRVVAVAVVFAEVTIGDVSILVMMSLLCAMVTLTRIRGTRTVSHNLISAIIITDMHRR